MSDVELFTSGNTNLAAETPLLSTSTLAPVLTEFKSNFLLHAQHIERISARPHRCVQEHAMMADTSRQCIGYEIADTEGATPA